MADLFDATEDEDLPFTQYTNDEFLISLDQDIKSTNQDDIASHFISSLSINDLDLKKEVRKLVKEGFIRGKTLRDECECQDGFNDGFMIAMILGRHCGRFYRQVFSCLLLLLSHSFVDDVTMILTYFSLSPLPPSSLVTSFCDFNYI